MLKNVALNVIEKSKAFVFGAGKMILAISIVLWFLASFGPSQSFSNAEVIVKDRIKKEGLSEFNAIYLIDSIIFYEKSLQKSASSKKINQRQLLDSIKIRKAALFTKLTNQEIASYKLERSFIGIIGKTIEPAIKPLGYDWKIGIAVISSFAAREVFVGTLATIYSVGGSDNEETIKNKMKDEVNPVTGDKIFNFASGISLLLFYAFAMQCASTLAVTKKETNSWKWPLVQLVFMSGLAYVVALLTYQILK